MCYVYSYSFVFIGAGNHVLKWTITGEPFAHCIAPGATVKFDWEGPFHNVEKVDKEERECRVNFFIVTKSWTARYGCALSIVVLTLLSELVLGAKWSDGSSIIDHANDIRLKKHYFWSKDQVVNQLVKTIEKLKSKQL